MNPEKELDSFLLSFLRVFSATIFFIVILIVGLNSFLEQKFCPIGFSDVFLFISAVSVFSFTVAAEHLLNLMELLKWK